MKIALDLFCGTGGATAAFRAAGWQVVGIDNDPRRAADVLADARRLPITGRVDFLWASPPCQEFSTMPPGRDDRRPSLDLVFAALCAVRDLRPRFWIIENVVGALPFLGLPRQKIGPFCLWGYFPKIKAPLEVVSHRKMTPDKKTAVARAAIPYALSLAVLQSVECAWDKKTIADLRPYRRHRHLAKINRTGPAWRPSHGHAADARLAASAGPVAISPASRPHGRPPALGHMAGELAGHAAGGPGATATGPAIEDRPRGRPSIADDEA